MNLTLKNPALLITVTGEVVPVELPTATRDRLTTMYSVLRCWAVDVVAITTQMDMWLDDEGLYNHPVNPAATLLARRFGLTHQSYHGPVLITGAADAEGETLPLTEDKLRAVLAALEDL